MRLCGHGGCPVLALLRRPQPHDLPLLSPAAPPTVLPLQDSCQEYLQEDKLKELVQRYSEFINFPIFMLTHSTVEKEVGQAGM